MKISFVVPCSNLVNYGARTLSSFLKSHGHWVQLFFVLIEKNRFGEALSELALDQLAEEVRGAGLIGLSFTTNFLGFADQITQHLQSKLPQIPIVWGGIHPTIDPGSCRRPGVLLCRGEGEEQLLHLIQLLEQGKDLNSWDSVPRLLQRSLDELPDPDYDLSQQFLLYKGIMIKLTSELLKTHLMKLGNKSRYSVFTSRHCPGRCSFCCNDPLRKIHSYFPVFKRSLNRVIDEIKRNVQEFGFESVCIQDENFLVRTMDEILEFCHRYEAEIALPFQCEFSPSSFYELKVRHLIRAGLKSVQIGIQSINKETNRTLYHRYYSRQRVEKIVDFFDQYQKEVTCSLHFLTHNPWESKESKVESIQYIASLPPYINAKLYPLIFYPSTEFYQRAMKEGLIQDLYQDIVYKNWGIERLMDGDFLDFLFYLVNFMRRTNQEPELIGSVAEDAVNWEFSLESLEKMKQDLVEAYKRQGIE